MKVVPKKVRMTWAPHPKNLEQYLALHAALLRIATSTIHASLKTNPKMRVSVGDIAFAVHKTMALPDHIMEWRLVAILSTAVKLGAFATEGVELRRGVGFTYKNKSWSEYWAARAA